MPSDMDVALKAICGCVRCGWKSVGASKLRAHSVLIISVIIIGRLRLSRKKSQSFGLGEKVVFA